MMTSVGMNASKRKKLVLTESMTSVICAIAATIPFSIVIIGIMTKMAYALEMGFDMALSWSSVPLFAAAAAVIILIASLSTMRKSGKLNVIAELKYE
jgi:putative ABC transport system permease protein